MTRGHQSHRSILFGNTTDPLPYGRGSLGYIIGRDRYMKRDDVGILYQVNVVPEMQRQLVGTTLLKALFAGRG